MGEVTSDDKLGRYHDTRHFSRTPEPAGRVDVGRSGARRFVVQRHRASRLHYDLRFEIDGVLVSWAVPRGPTLDPSARRMAVHVEDHPVEYAEFEGVIPAAEYGGGDVIVWDHGTWEPHGTDDPGAAVAAGELHADVHGEKLSRQLVPTLVEPFQRGTERIRTDHAGVGLGLAIVKSITQAHDGTLTLAPRAAGGLCVTVQLPAAPSHAGR